MDTPPAHTPRMAPQIVLSHAENTLLPPMPSSPASISSVLSADLPIARISDEALQAFANEIGFTWAIVHPDDMKDRVFVAIIKALVVARNQPCSPKQLARSVLGYGFAALGYGVYRGDIYVCSGSTPYATISSRISQHFKRAADHRPPRKPLLGKVVDPLHARKISYYLLLRGDSGTLPPSPVEQHFPLEDGLSRSSLKETSESDAAGINKSQRKRKRTLYRMPSLELTTSASSSTSRLPAMAPPPPPKERSPPTNHLMVPALSHMSKRLRSQTIPADAQTFTRLAAERNRWEFPVAPRYLESDGDGDVSDVDEGYKADWHVDLQQTMDEDEEEMEEPQTQEQPLEYVYGSFPSMPHLRSLEEKSALQQYRTRHAIDSEYSSPANLPRTSFGVTDQRSPRITITNQFAPVEDFADVMMQGDLSLGDEIQDRLVLVTPSTSARPSPQQTNLTRMDGVTIVHPGREKSSDAFDRFHVQDFATGATLDLPLFGDDAHKFVLPSVLPESLVSSPPPHPHTFVTHRVELNTPSPIPHQLSDSDMDETFDKMHPPRDPENMSMSELERMFASANNSTSNSLLLPSLNNDHVVRPLFLTEGVLNWTTEPEHDSEPSMKRVKHPLKLSVTPLPGASSEPNTSSSPLHRMHSHQTTLHPRRRHRHHTNLRAVRALRAEPTRRTRTVQSEADTRSSEERSLTMESDGEVASMRKRHLTASAL